VSTPHTVTPVGLDPRRYQSLGDLLDDALVTWKSETALVEADRYRETRRYTYRELRRLALRVAARLRDLGVGPGTRVAMLASNQSAWAVAAIAALWRGAVLVPLDYKLEAAEQAALLRHARPSVLVAEWPYLRKLASHGVSTVIALEAPPGADLGGALRWEDLPPEGSSAPIEPRQPEDVAAIVYSSGTGGRPKGCLLPHRAYLHQLGALLDLYPMHPGEAFFSILPTNHAIDFLAGFIGPLVCGATVVHQRTLRPEFLISTLQRYSPTHMAVVPAILSALDRSIHEKLDALEGAPAVASDAARAIAGWLSSRGMQKRLLKPVHDALGGRLKVMFCGGAWTDRALAERFADLGIPVVIGYGLTEACTVATLNRTSPYRADSVGSPVDGVEVRIDSPDATGAGEVQLRGPTIMLGYLDDPQLTAETFTSDGWLRTGDLGRFDASWHLHLVGRSKDVIVTAGGKNVYPEDVEGAFSKIDAEEVAVFAENTLWPRPGLGADRLVAVVRPRSGGWRARFRSSNLVLAGHKRVRGLVEWTSPFPRTATLKVKRLELAAQVRERVAPEQLEDV
jgi:long-chain acyl-CoA synthetase